MSAYDKIAEIVNVDRQVVKSILHATCCMPEFRSGYTGPPEAVGLGLFRCVARTELKELVPDVPDEVLRYLNHAITEAFYLGYASKESKE